MDSNKPYVQSPVIIANLRLDGSTIYTHFPTPELLREPALKTGAPMNSMPWWSATSTRSDIQSLLDSATGGESACLSNLPYHSTTGATRMMELWAHPGSFDEQGANTVMMVGTDTTELTHQLDELTISETKFRVMSHTLPALVWMHDSQGQHEFANDTFCDFFGVSQEELRGDKWQMLVHPDDTHYTELFYKSFRQKKPFHAEVRARNNSNEWRHLESFATPHFLQDGAFNGFVGVSIDITERKAALDNLTEAARRKNTFLATLAHELRNPLLSVLTGSELLQLDQSIGHDSKNTIQIIARQANQLARLIDDILDVNRLDQGKFSINPAVVCMQSIINTVIDNLRERINTKEHKVDVASAPGPVWVWGDEVRLIQALTNVISNAIRCTPSSGQLHIKIAVVETRCEVLIMDNGPGIKQHEIEKIFDLYYSTQTETMRGEINLGIGLWLTRTILEKHGGDIIAQRRERGSGAAFQISIPMATKAQMALADSAIPHDIVTTEPKKPFRVVIVEDNFEVASTLASAVKHFGGDSHIEHDGDDVVDVITSFNPDIVILDIGLPTINGIQAAQNIKDALGQNSPRLVALSGWSNKQKIERAKKAGFDEYLVKPVTLTEIRKLIDSIEQ